MGRVFNDRNAILVCERADLRHIAGKSAVMHADNRPGSVGDFALQVFDRKVQRARIDVDEFRLRPDV